MNMPKKGLTAFALMVATAWSAQAQTATPPTLASLNAQVQSLAAELKQVSVLATRQQQTIASLQASNDGLVKRLACVATVSGTRDFVFDGCNVHVRNGSGSTSAVNSYGNLIVGYNKNEVWSRTGSHNIVVGDLNDYLSHSGIVSGTNNVLAAARATILSGSESRVNFSSGVILGADKGIANANSVIIGGVRGTTSADGKYAVVIGGNENSADGNNAVAVGGIFNHASGTNSLACGGSENKATGSAATACGGSGNESLGLHSLTSGGSHNTAASRASAVTGGQHCSSGAVDYKWVVGTLATPGGCTGYAN